MIIGLPSGILFCPTMLDLTSLIGESQANISANVSSTLNSFKAKCTHEKLRVQITQLASNVGHMSNQQMLRLAAWAKCISRSISDSVIFHSGDNYHNSWSSLRFEIDPVQQKGGTEKSSFEFLLPAWIRAWSFDDPMATIEGVHTADHPFVKNWECVEGIDIGKMFKNNVHYVPSEHSLGIQLADVTASLIRRAVIGLATAPNLHNYGALLTRTIGKPLHATGIFFLAPHEIADTERRYKGLADAINAARATIPNSYCH